MTAERVAIGLAAALLAFAGAAEARCSSGAPPPLSATVRTVAALDGAWSDYKARHITPEGRVVDGANGGISHSEGQGYAMLIAAKLGDREAFDRIFAWTVANLGVREDRLFAWRWSPTIPPVQDLNNATDGDILIVWALMEAVRLWEAPVYREAARAIATDIARHAIRPSPLGPLLMPAASGFGPEERDDGPVVNLSYFIFPAEPALAAAAPDTPWSEVFAVGRRLLHEAGETLPPEWSAVGGDGAAPAADFDPVFGYNAIRVPLYVAWGGCDEALLTPFDARWQSDRHAPRLVDVATGFSREPFGEGGYRSIPALVACALASDDTGKPVSLAGPEQNYYPRTLQILATIAQLELYPWCID